MTASKEEALQVIRTLPEECTLTEILAELDFIRKVEQGLKEIEEGRPFSRTEVSDRLAGPHRLGRDSLPNVKRFGQERTQRTGAFRMGKISKNVSAD